MPSQVLYPQVAGWGLTPNEIPENNFD